jgi:hypothetical protein
MTIPAQISPRVAALLKKTRAMRGRLIFALDATASRESTWDLASQNTAGMFLEAARIGGLDVQLVYFRGSDEVRESAWLADAHDLIRRMSVIRCESGATKIARVLAHIRAENNREKVAAAVFIGDAVEEPPSSLYDAAADLGVPTFFFQEGSNEAIWPDGPDGYSPKIVTVEQVFRELARLTGGAYGKFDAGAARQLGELLRAIAAFAAGGSKALGDLQTETARKLLDQISER